MYREFFKVHKQPKNRPQTNNTKFLSQKKWWLLKGSTIYFVKKITIDRREFYLVFASQSCLTYPYLSNINPLIVG
jgi:hypothetical protein